MASKQDLTSNELSCSKCQSECYFMDTSKSREIKELFGASCDLCKSVFCRKVTSNEIRVLTSQNRLLSYHCLDCLNSIRGMISDLAAVKQQVDNLCLETRELKNQINMNTPNTSPSYAQVVADTNSLKDQVEKLKKSVESQPTAVPNNTQPQTVELTIEELNERERRKQNVVLVGVKESTKTTFEERISDEIDMAKQVLQKIDDNVKLDNIKVRRLGTYDGVKHRPLRIVLETREDAAKILRNKTKLTEKEKDVYVKYDQTRSQLQFLRSVQRVLEERKKVDSSFTIKYFSGIPKIVKSKTTSKN